jgi:hypothetical protein
MPYGTIKIDTITFTDAGVDKSVSVSGLVENPTFTGNVTATGTISGAIVQAVTVTGTTANFVSGVYTTQISGAIVRVPAGSAGAPSIQVGVGASVAPGLYGAGTDLLGISTGGAGRVFVDSTGRLGIGTSTPASPLTIIGAVDGVSFGTNTTSLASSTANGVFSPAGNTLGFTTNATERMRIDSSGRLLVGTSTVYGISGLANPDVQLSKANQDSTLAVTAWKGDAIGFNPTLQLMRSYNNTAGTHTAVPDGARLGSIRFAGSDGTGFSSGAEIVASADGQTWATGDCPGRLIFSTTADGAASPTERMRIDSSGRVGIGGISPGAALHVQSAIPQVFLSNSQSTAADKFAHICGLQRANDTEPEGFSIIGSQSTSTDNIVYIGGFFGEANAATAQIFYTAANNTTRSGTERARIDSSGRLLVGTSTARSNYSAYGVALLQAEGANNDGARAFSFTYGKADAGDPIISLGKHRSNSVGGVTIVSDGDGIGQFVFAGSDGTNFVTGARISAQVDGTPGTNDMPGRLVFSTTADGASSPTEKMRIDNVGNITWNGAGLKLTTGRNISATADNSNINIFGGDITTNPGANIELYGGTHVSLANVMILDANEHRFRTANGATERMRISSNGNVGIGTASPSQPLQVNGNALIGATPATQYSNLTVVGTSGIQAAAPLLNLTDAAGSTRFAYFQHTGTGGDLFFLNQEAGSMRFGTSNTERARIDSSGRLLVGTSSASTFIGTGFPSFLQLQESSGTLALGLERPTNDASGASVNFRKTRSTSSNGLTAVQSGDIIGEFRFAATDGTGAILAANIAAVVDGTPGTNDMPGRLVFSTTADGASSPTEQLRISNGGTVIYNQPAPAAVDVTATLTVANLTAKIITSSTAAAVTMTLPTGTLMDGGFGGLYNNMAFEWSVINTGATNAVTVQGGTGHTVVGSGTVAASNSGRFLSRRTGATTWVTYKLSS